MQGASWRKIADELAARIETGELLPGSRIEPEEALATRLNVSRHTAHRALHELQRLGLVVRQRRWGTVVADRTQAKKKRVAYLVDFASNRFQADIMMHIEHELEDGTRLVVSTSKNDPEREAENLDRLTREVDGIICYPADGDANGAAFNELAQSGFPLVLVDRAPRGCEHLVVLTDNVQSSHLAVRRLMDKGHRRIAFFGSDNDTASSVRERHDGYVAAIGDAGFNARPYERWIHLVPEHLSEGMFQSVMDALTAMRCLPEPPTAAFCVQDRLAMGLIEACAMQSLTIGVDFDIATFNDYGPMFLRQHWRVNRILQQVDQISVLAVERLNALMAGQKVSHGPVRVPARFVPAQDPEVLVNSSFAALSKSA
ncbi:LacI family transcriptional regulator [bacterium]|nr:MAG: LacI family transcriptional regulator [bacterium]